MFASLRHCQGSLAANITKTGACALTPIPARRADRRSSRADAVPVHRQPEKHPARAEADRPVNNRVAARLVEPGLYRSSARSPRRPTV